MSAQRLEGVASIADSIFAEIEASAGQVTDEQLQSLHFLFEKNFAKAAAIVDAGSVTRFEGERTARRAWQVPAARAHERYTVVGPRHFCGCHAFFFDVVQKADAAYCKHQLAVLLAEATRRTRVCTVGDGDVAELLQQ